MGLFLTAAFVAVSAVHAEEAAACSPRTFSSIQPPELHHDEVPSDTDVAEQPAGETAGALEVDETPVDDMVATPETPWIPPPAVCSFIYRMEFPVLGGGDPGWSLFGEPRDGGARLHAGVDVLAP